MASIPHIAAYLAMTVALASMIARFLMWIRMPMHLRWELYPVAHEGRRAQYGGSYLEEYRWWSKPREVSLIGELKVMIPEILFLECLWKNNRTLWLRSFPFHFGLYLVIGGTVLLAVNGGVAALWPAAAEAIGGVLGMGVAALLVPGLCLGLLGAVGLLQRRLADPNLRVLNTTADILNLLVFALVFGWALFTWLLVDRDLSLATAFMGGLLTFDLGSFASTGAEAVTTTVAVLLMSLLCAYVPLTHMSHFIGKYFAYHDIRWDDAPTLPGERGEATIDGLLKRPVSWAAPHIQGDGRKTWAALASEENKA